MKTLSKTITGSYPMIAVIFFAIFMWSCGGGQNKVQNEQLKEAKETTTQNLNKYKNEIEERIDYVEGQIEEASGEMKEELEESRAALKEQQELLEAELENVQDATVDSWNDVVSQASQSLTQARSKMNEVSKNVRELLEGEEE